MKLQAIIAPRIAPQRRLLTATIVTQQKYVAHQIFEGYLIGIVKVRLFYSLERIRKQIAFEYCYYQ